MLGVAPQVALGVPPPGSCYDARYYDAADTRSSASLCASALDQAGYAGTAYTNSLARNAYLRADAVFSFAGHSFTYTRGTSSTAIGLVYESPGPGGNTIDSLGGDNDAALAFSGPPSCSPSEPNCKATGPLILYPWANNPANQLKANLVVMGGCQTARTDGPYTDMTTLASKAGAGTAIGFRGDIASAQSPNTGPNYTWSQTFWSDLAARHTYATAVVAAANAVGNTGGYETYVIQQRSTGPKSLYPAQFHKYAASGVAATAASAPRLAPSSLTASGTSAAPVTAAVRDFLGREARVADTTTGVGGSGRKEVTVRVPGTGLFSVDAVSSEVTEAVFERQLIRKGPVKVGLRAARLKATRFARRHFRDFDGLASRSVRRVDHGDFDEVRTSWQAKRGGAWLPTKVTVGVNSVTGGIAYYSSDRLPTRVGTRPAVSAANARRSAATASRLAGPLVVGRPRLEVVRDGNRTPLAWVTRVRRRPPLVGLFRPDARIVRTDALTGSSKVW